MSERWDRSTVFGGVAKLLVVLGVVLAVVLFAFWGGRRLEPGRHDFADARLSVDLPSGAVDRTGLADEADLELDMHTGRRVVVTRLGTRVHSWVDENPGIVDYGFSRWLPVHGADEAWVVEELDLERNLSTRYARVLVATHVLFLCVEHPIDSVSMRTEADAILASIEPN